MGPWVALLVLGVAGNIRQTLHEAYTAEVFLGILVGLPLVLWLARRPARPWDDWLGNLSYGVFLCRNLVLAGIERTALFRGRWSLCLAATVVSMLLAWLSYLAVERPLIAWRHTLRRRTGLATVHTAFRIWLTVSAYWAISSSVRLTMVGRAMER